VEIGNFWIGYEYEVDFLKILLLFLLTFGVVQAQDLKEVPRIEKEELEELNALKANAEATNLLYQHFASYLSRKYDAESIDLKTGEISKIEKEEVDEE